MEQQTEHLPTAIARPSGRKATVVAREVGSSPRALTGVRALAVGLALALVLFVATAGHVVFLALLFIPIGLFSFGRRRSRRDRL